ncbi:hypothetical protein GLOIN_2v1707095 [Rhizophagus clarus]|uniref:Uncharacterized protein n=1 Tax=Rhizophagus clarus TaxID=94130 RepID=A0A8H3KXE2_9GLOM|nr:hypothetical protein GLOIN_2v1707095 [Rhizophagus clarus]
MNLITCLNIHASCNEFQAEWNVAKINSNDSKLLNLGEVFLQEIIFYIICAGTTVVSNSDRNKLGVEVYKKPESKEIN